MMRTLGASVLIFEWIVLALALPVAINIGGLSAQVGWIGLGVCTVLFAAAIATLPRRSGQVLGWAAQAPLLVTSIVVPVAVILAVAFIGLWIMALRLGGQVDRAKAQNSGQEGDTSDRTHVDTGQA